MPPRCRSEALASWAWWQHLEAEAGRQGQGLLRVSLDETCVCLVHTGAKGTVMRCWPGSSAQVEAVAVASRHQLRSSFTHVAMICDDARVQPFLPQLLVANEATMSRADATFLRAAVPGNVYLVRQKKAWMTADLMVWLVKVLGQCVKERLGARRLVISLDCAKIHLHERVVRAMARAGAWCTVVPAKMAWLLQPCDAHLFVAYKRHLRAGLQNPASPLEGCGRTLACRAVMQVCKTIAEVMDTRSWARAFNSCGCGGSMERVGSRVLKALRWEAVPPVSADRPSLGQLACVYPRRYRIPYAALRVAVGGSAAVPDEVSAESDADPPGAAAESAESVWLGRTRSTSRLQLAEHPSPETRLEPGRPSASGVSSTALGSATGPAAAWAMPMPTVPAQQPPAPVPRGVRLPRPSGTRLASFPKTRSQPP